MTAGCPPVADHDANHTSRKKRVEAEQRLLVQWARENGKLGLSGRRLPVFARGGEHEVFFQRRTQRYLKATRLDKHKGYGIALGSHTHRATPSEYLDRLLLHNDIFNDDVRLERVVENDGKPIIVTSQPAIKGHVPSQAALDDLMLDKAYEKNWLKDLTTMKKLGF